MKRLLNFLLLLSFQFGYLEWGKDKHMFIFEAEGEIFSKANTNPENLFHPFIFIPLCGIILLVYTLFQSSPNRVLSLIGLACLSILMLLLLFIGSISPNLKILGSTIPFLVIGFLVLRKNLSRKVAT